MARRVVKCIVALLVALPVIVCMLWARSYWRVEQFAASRTYRYIVRMDHGRITFVKCSCIGEFFGTGGWSLKTVTYRKSWEFTFYPPPPNPNGCDCDFGADPRLPTAEARSLLADCPTWPAAATTTAPALVLIGLRVRQQRRRADQRLPLVRA